MTSGCALAISSTLVSPIGPTCGASKCSSEGISFNNTLVSTGNNSRAKAEGPRVSIQTAVAWKIGNKVDEFAEAALIEGFAGVVLGEDAFERRIIFFDGEHGFVEEF